MDSQTTATVRPLADLSSLVPADQWQWYRGALEGIRATGVASAVGGGLAFSAYLGRWRNTKDIDFYVRPEDRQAMIESILAAGFVDYHSQRPYDRAWIFRGYREGIIVDVIWQMANKRAVVDGSWLRGGMLIALHGLQFRLLPVEELIWSKLYVLQRDRCDWPDLLTLLQSQGLHLDWRHLVELVGPDQRLLGGLLAVYAWLCPADAGQLPEWIWARTGGLPPDEGPDCQRQRRQVLLLDSREWFVPQAE